MRWLATALLMVIAVGLGGGEARAHALQPGYLELQLPGPDSWRAFWRKPAVGRAPMLIEVSLPASCDQRTAPPPGFDGTAYVAQWLASCPGGIAGGEIAIPGLAATRTDVLVRFEFELGRGEARRRTPDAPAFIVPTALGRLDPRLIDRLQRPRSASMATVANAIGGIAAFWFLERVAAF